jgi:hypothetical protein
MITSAASMIPCLVRAGFAGRSRLLRRVGALSFAGILRQYHEHVRYDHVRDDDVRPAVDPSGAAAPPNPGLTGEDVLMLMLVLIGLLGAASIAISPRVPPVEPPAPVTTTTRVVSSADGGAIVVAVPDTPARPKRSRRPYAVDAALVLGFGLCTLLGSVAVGPLGMPAVVPRGIGFGLLCAGHLLGPTTAAFALGVAAALPFCTLVDTWPVGTIRRVGGAVVLALAVGVALS